MELETDKAVVEVPSSVSGTVQEIRVKEGDKIKVGQVIFTVDGAEGKPSPESSARTPATEPSPVQQKPIQKPIQKEEAQQTHADTESSPAPVEANPAATSPPDTRPSAALPLPGSQPRHPSPEPANSNYPNSGKTFRKAIWFA